MVVRWWPTANHAFWGLTVGEKGSLSLFQFNHPETMAVVGGTPYASWFRFGLPQLITPNTTWKGLKLALELGMRGIHWNAMLKERNGCWRRSWHPGLLFSVPPCLWVFQLLIFFCSSPKCLTYVECLTINFSVACTSCIKLLTVFFQNLLMNNSFPL